MKLDRAAIVGILTCGAVLGWAATPGKDSRQFLNPGGEKPPGYTEVVSSPPGRMIFISGQGGTDSKGNLPSDFASQARNTFLNIRRCLDLAGAGFKDIIKINYYVTGSGADSQGIGDNGIWRIAKLNGILYLLDVGSKTTSFSSAFAGIFASN